MRSLRGRTSTCEGCGAEIVWGTTAYGADVPIDAESRHMVTVIVLEDERGTAVGPREAVTVHFETCPVADQFRQTPEHVVDERQSDMFAT